MPALRLLLDRIRNGRDQQHNRVSAAAHHKFALVNTQENDRLFVTQGNALHYFQPANTTLHFGRAQDLKEPFPYSSQD
jgi:hypothetical protein